MCPQLSNCSMFAIFKMEASLRLWQVSYCEATKAEYTQCERFKQSEAGAMVPPNLLPNGKLLKIRTGKG